MGDELVEEMANLNIEPPEHRQAAWEAVYDYIYPHLKREYDVEDMLYTTYSLDDSNVLTASETEREIEKARTNMRRIIQVQHYLRRLAGRRHY